MSRRPRRSWLARYLAAGDATCLLLIVLCLLLMGSIASALPMWYAPLFGLLSLAASVALVAGRRWAVGDGDREAGR